MRREAEHLERNLLLAKLQFQLLERKVRRLIELERKSPSEDGSGKRYLANLEMELCSLALNLVRLTS